MTAVATIRFPDHFPHVFYRVTVNGEVMHFRSDDTLVLNEPSMEVTIDLADANPYLREIMGMAVASRILGAEAKK